MTDKFPKQYVLDRIDARKGRLAIEKSQVLSEQTDLQDRLRDALDTLVEENVKRIEAYVDTAHAAQKTYEAETDFNAKMKAAETLSRNVSSLRSTYNVKNLAQSKSGNLTDLATRLKQIENEVESLDHTRIYLEGMPVDEFSLASLRSLGLLPILKFSLADVKGQEK